jgi:hypothetical protein
MNVFNEQRYRLESLGDAKRSQEHQRSKNPELPTAPRSAS